MIYVDAAIWKCGRMVMCHMIADTPDELHRFANELGLKRSWYQGDHYDICKRKRSIAVESGAVALGRRDFVYKLRAYRTA